MSAGKILLGSRLTIGFLFFLIPYNLLMYGVNDIFDYESDLRNPRKQSIEGALVPRAFHRMLWTAIGISVVPLVAWLLTIGSPTAGGVLLFSLFMVVAYSLKGLRFKEVPVLDSLTSSIHFWSPFAYGAVLAGGKLPLGPASLAFLAWGAASHALGAIQDVRYDKEGGIRSIATVLGARVTAIAATAAYVASAACLVVGYGSSGVLPAGIVLLFAVNSGRFLTVTDQESPRTREAWKVFLLLNYYAGFLLTLEFISLGWFSRFGLEHGTALRFVAGLLTLAGLACIALRPGMRSHGAGKV